MIDEIRITCFTHEVRDIMSILKCCDQFTLFNQHGKQNLWSVNDYFTYSCEYSFKIPEHFITYIIITNPENIYNEYYKTV